MLKTSLIKGTKPTESTPGSSFLTGQILEVLTFDAFLDIPNGEGRIRDLFTEKGCVRLDERCYMPVPEDELSILVACLKKNPISDWLEAAIGGTSSGIEDPRSAAAESSRPLGRGDGGHRQSATTREPAREAGQMNTLPPRGGAGKDFGQEWQEERGQKWGSGSRGSKWRKN